jgi:hypothetical protein
MSGHHDTHHVNENKPVAFTVPLILAIVTLVIIMLFLSLCDPSSAHHNTDAHEHGAASTSQQDHGSSKSHSTGNDNSHDQGPEGGQETHHQ